MTKAILAQQLRERQVKKGLVPFERIQAASDDEIILSYVTCSACGEQKVTDEELDLVIRMSESAEDFMRGWSEISTHWH